MTGPPDVPVRIRGLRRTFGSVVALDDARLEVRSGEVHALVGENGAGKTTLLSILAGHLTPDAGTIEIDGHAIPDRGWTTREAWDRGVGMVHQHFALVPRLTGEENLSLGVRRARGGWALPTDWIRERVGAIREETGLDVDLGTPVEELSIGERQRLEIMKVLLRDPRILVLDEPTAVLAPSEVDGLLTLLRRLAGEGRAVLFVAHKLDEVLRVADRITVLRSGRTVLESNRSNVTARSVAEAMVGDAEALDAPERTEVVPGEVRARWLGRDDGTDLELRSGEIVGIAGVEGNGQRTLARALAGRELEENGRVHLPDGVAYIPQDRGREGLISSFDLTENVAPPRRSGRARRARATLPALGRADRSYPGDDPHLRHPDLGVTRHGRIPLRRKPAAARRRTGTAREPRPGRGREPDSRSGCRGRALRARSAASTARIGPRTRDRAGIDRSRRGARAVRPHLHDRPRTADRGARG